MPSLRHAIAFLLLGAASIAVCVNAFAENGATMLSDVTIYLEPPILDGGGTVIVLPKPVPVDKWRVSEGLDNPALKDRRLNQERPLKSTDLRLGAVVSDSISIVQFDYPEGGTFQFRFSPVLGSDYPLERLGSKVIGVAGVGQDMHPLTQEIVNVGPFQSVHILGKKTTEEDSRIAESTVRLGFLTDRYRCIKFDHVISCSASKDNLDE